MNPTYLERPTGTIDLYGESLHKKRWIEQEMIAVFQSFGYEMLETPMIEYVETIARGLHGHEEQLYRMFDRSGRTMALRPEMTTPVARVVATDLSDTNYPIRIAYTAKTYQADDGRLHEPVEMTQAGVELIGDASPDADAEVIALMATALRRLGIEHFRFAIGHMGYLRAMLAPLSEGLQVALRKALVARDLVHYEQILDGEVGLNSEWLSRLKEFPRIRGGIEAIAIARELALDERAKQACDEWEELFAVLEAHGVADVTQVDLGLYLNHEYYTGIVIEGYAEALGAPICFGGRYDGLLEQFGRKAPATGCVTHIERLLKVTSHVMEEAMQIHLCYLTEHRKQIFAFADYLRLRGYAVATSRAECNDDIDVTCGRANARCFGEFDEAGQLKTKDRLLKQMWEYYLSCGVGSSDRR